MYVCMHACMYVCMYIYTCIYMYIHICTKICIHRIRIWIEIQYTVPSIDHRNTRYIP